MLRLKGIRISNLSSYMANCFQKCNLLIYRDVQSEELNKGKLNVSEAMDCDKV